MTDNGTLLALDVGEKRIGVALASAAAKLASPYCTLQHTETILQDIQNLIEKESVQVIVVGLPRGMEGQETQQTKDTRAFAEHLKAAVQVPVYMQDETLTSVKAEEELGSRGKKFLKEDIDALAATYILEDFINTNKGLAI
jgi:putative Holliday junction resolvase